jgi:hypothetical protein
MIITMILAPYDYMTIHHDHHYDNYILIVHDNGRQTKQFPNIHFHDACCGTMFRPSLHCLAVVVELALAYSMP